MDTLEELQKKIKLLSRPELLSLQAQITTELGQKTELNTNVQTGQALQQKKLTLLDLIPGAYRPAKDQIEARLAAIFTPEELAEADKVDLNNLPPLSRSIAELINEDREDRPLPKLLSKKDKGYS